jgi:hypothetical protein
VLTYFAQIHAIFQFGRDILRTNTKIQKARQGLLEKIWSPTQKLNKKE